MGATTEGMEGLVEIVTVGDTEDCEVTTVVMGVVDRVVHTVGIVCEEGGGNTSPFCRGIGRVGLVPFPTRLPSPGNVAAGLTTAVLAAMAA